MTITNHALTGAIIGIKVKQPWLAAPLAFISHFLQDLIPHHDYFAGEDDKNLFSRKFFTLLFIDMLVASALVITVALMFPAHRWLILLCMFASSCPDMASGYYHLYLGHIKKQTPKIDPLSGFHYRLNRFKWSESPAGGLVEVAWFLAASTIILSLR